MNDTKNSESNKIEVTLSHYFTDDDVSDLKEVHLENYEWTVSRLDKTEQTGGLIWEGIVFFISGSITAGFFGAIGQDAYYWLKEKLFNKKQKLQKRNTDKFTINVKINNSMVFFNFTDLDKESFIEGFNKAKEALLEHEDYIKENSGYFDLNFNKQTKRWILERNKSFDI